MEILRSSRGNEVSASVPKRVTLAFRGSVSAESALVDESHEGSACSVAGEESVSSDGCSHFSSRPRIALLGLRKRRLPVDKSFSERVVTYLDCAWAEELVMVDRSGEQRKSVERGTQTRNFQWPPECGGPVHAKTCPNAGLRRCARARCVLAPRATEHDHTKIRELRRQPIGWGRPHINLGFLVGGLDSPTHENRIQHQLLFEDRTRQLTCKQKVKMVSPRKEHCPRHLHRSIPRPAPPRHPAIARPRAQPR